MTDMPETPSPKGMITSPHQLASQAGLDILKRGGNAIEAAITMGTCLAVVYPHFTGLGGDSFMLIANGSGEATSLSGIGQCCQAVPDFAQQISARGPQSCLTSAATVDALGQAFEMSQAKFGGQLSWTELLAPAIRLAKEGYPLSSSQHFWFNFRESSLAELPGVAALFSQDGKQGAIGSLVKQPQLAKTLETLAERGYRDFYEGELAGRIAEGLQQAGAPLTADDLAATRAREEAPLRLPYRQGELLAHQPPTQGVTTLEIMGILEQFDVGALTEGGGDYYHLLVEAVKCAFIDRNRGLADPDFSQVPVETWLSPAYLAEQAASISLTQARPWPEVFQPADTVFLAATDASGLSVSLLQTIYYDWGSGVAAGDTGILWHNRGAAFSLDPQHPNAIAPGKRPFHTLNPGVYLKDGKPMLLYGTQGADGQPQTLAAILTRLIDYGLSPEEALRRPRFLLGKTFSNSSDNLKLEADAGPSVFAQLTGMGHQIIELPAQSPLAGQPGVIRIDPLSGELSGAHDPRGDGCALSL